MSTTRITTTTTLTSSRRLRTFVGACMLMFMAPAVAEDAHVVYAYGAEAVNLDAADAIDGPSFDVVYNIHEGLVGLSETGEIVPVLATSWSLSDDRLSWTFNLREGVKFHDGTDFNADVVKFNLDRVMDAANELGNVKQWEPHIASVEVVDASTVRINTKKPYGSLLSLLASDFGKLMNSPDAVAQHGDQYGRNPVGTGPFVFESWNPGVNLVLKKNPDYWGGHAGHRFGGVPAEPRRQCARACAGVGRRRPHQPGAGPGSGAASGERQVRSVQPDDLPVVLLGLQPYEGRVVEPPGTHRAESGRRPTEHCRQRALRRGRSRQFLHLPRPSTVPSRSTSMDTIRPPRGRCSRRRTSRSTGRSSVYITEGRYYQDRQVAEVLQGMLQEIGLKIQLEVIEWGAFVDAVWFTPAEDAAAQARDIVQTSYGTEDPPTWMRQTLTSYNWPKNGFNEAFYANKEVDRLIDASNESTISRGAKGHPCGHPEEPHRGSALAHHALRTGGRCPQGEAGRIDVVAGGPRRIQECKHAVSVGGIGSHSVGLIDTSSGSCRKPPTSPDGRNRVTLARFWSRTRSPRRSGVAGMHCTMSVAGAR